MTRHLLLLLAALALATACHRPGPAERAAGPILEQNAAARGGRAAWRAVKTLSLSGQLDAGRRRDPAALARELQRQGRMSKAEARAAALHPRAAEAPAIQLPFTLELKRPRKTRVEVSFRGQAAVQVWDGAQGWKLRPFLGRHEVEPFTAEERRVAAAQAELDGPLLDAEDAGSKVELEGRDRLEGRDAWRLKVTARDGQVRHVWVDAESGLDVRVDGTRRVDGKLRQITTTYREFRTVDGLVIPHLLETAVEGVRGTEKLVVQQVAVNPDLPDGRFGRPD